MTVKNPKCLVVDTNIAQSAGGHNALDPIPILCRDFLEEIRKTGHSIIMTMDINSSLDK